MNDNLNREKLSAMAKAVQELKEQNDIEIREFKNREFNSIVAAGGVKVFMKGDGSIQRIALDPDFLASHTSDQIADALVEAFNSCKRTIDSMLAEINERFNRNAQVKMMQMYMASKQDGGADGGEGNQ